LRVEGRPTIEPVGAERPDPRHLCGLRDEDRAALPGPFESLRRQRCGPSAAWEAEKNKKRKKNARVLPENRPSIELLRFPLPPLAR